MKRFLAILICALLLLTGCNAADDGEDIDTDPTSQSDSGSDSSSDSESSDKEEEKSLYKIICPQGSIHIQKLAKSIRDKIKKDHGVTLELSNDSGGASAVSKYEILVGDTNRAESELGYAEAGAGGWWVSAEGQRIVINGGTLAGITEAVEHFLKSYSYKDGKVLIAKSKEKTVFKDSALLGKNITLRVGSYNIKKAMGKDGEDGKVTKAQVQEYIQLLAQDIKDKNLDIVGLQEIDKGCTRTHGLDIAKLVAEAAGYNYYFSRAIDYQGGYYGSAILSKHEIKDSRTVVLPRDPAFDNEERVVGVVTVNFNGNDIKFLNTHLTVHGNATEIRRAQILKIAELVDGVEGFIVTGDFNTADASARAIIPNSIQVNSSNRYKTYDNASPIDDIILESNWKVAEAGMNDAVDKGHTDHNMLWAEIKYTGGK